MFHKYVLSDTLRSYLAVNQEVAKEFERKISPADIPVMVKEYTEEVYPEVVKNINDLGKIAVEKIHPWITNLLIDRDKFDSIICTKIVEGLFIDNEDIVLYIPHIYKYQWTKHNVNKLIDYHTTYEPQFTKPSVNKMTVCKLIAEEINKGDGNTGMVVSAIQCEQKWKNITKKFRDTLDHNRKSGNDKKVCPFYDELEACYGYRPNVCPQYTASSITCSRKLDNNDLCQDESKSTFSVSSSPSTDPKRQKKSSEIVGILKDIHEEMKAEQNRLITTYEKQHEDRMAQESKINELLASLVSSMKK